MIWLMGVLGAMTVVFNFGYQKIERPDLLLPIIQRDSYNPISLAYAYKNLGQTRELIGLGWEFKRLSRSGNDTTTAAVKHPPLFLLVHQKPNSASSAIALKNTLTQLPRPLNLWIVNFPRAVAQLGSQNCVVAPQPTLKIDGYKYKLFHCQ